MFSWIEAMTQLTLASELRVVSLWALSIKPMSLEPQVWIFFMNFFLEFIKQKDTLFIVSVGSYDHEFNWHKIMARTAIGGPVLNFCTSSSKWLLMEVMLLTTLHQLVRPNTIWLLLDSITKFISILFNKSINSWLSIFVCQVLQWELVVA